MSCGQVTVNLANFIKEPNYKSMHGQKIKMPIEKCPDKTSYLEFEITSVLIAAISDTMSTMSGLDNMSCGSGLESEFEFKDHEIKHI